MRFVNCESYKYSQTRYYIFMPSYFLNNLSYLVFSKDITTTNL